LSRASSSFLLFAKAIVALSMAFALFWVGLAAEDDRLHRGLHADEDCTGRLCAVGLFASGAISSGGPVTADLPPPPVLEVLLPAPVSERAITRVSRVARARDPPAVYLFAV
jgi:hypothetical protein